MPAKSASQQRAAGMALAAKRGELDPDRLKGSAKQMYKSMSAKELEDFAETKRSKLPEKKKENKGKRKSSNRTRKVRSD